MDERVFISGASFSYQRDKLINIILTKQANGRRFDKKPYLFADYESSERIGVKIVCSSKSWWLAIEFIGLEVDK